MKKIAAWHLPRHRTALCISLLYLIAGAVWILYSDRLLALLAPDADRITEYQSYKGWLFVALSAVLLYAMALRWPQQPPPALADGNIPGDERRMRLLIAAFAALFLLAIVVNLAFALLQARRNVLTEAGGTAQKFTQVLEAQTGGSIHAVDLALQSSARAMALLPASPAQRTRQIDDLLRQNAQSLSFVRAIWVLDADGNMIQDSQNLPGHYNLADREYFRVQRDDPNVGLFIDRPIPSRLGVWFIGVSRRIVKPDGSFGGVIVAALEPAYFQQFYESIKVGKDGVVALMRTDGTLMLRVPSTDAQRGQKLHPLPGFVSRLPKAAAGTYRSTSSIDGVQRMYFYRQVGDTPLVVLVGLGEQEVLAAWRGTAQAYVAVTLAFLLLIGWLGYLVWRELRRRALLNQALAASEGALAIAQQLSQVGSWQMDFPRNTARWSNQMYRLLGFDPARPTPSLASTLKRFHPDDRPAIEKAIHNGEPVTGELRSDPAHGPLRHFVAHSTQVFDAEGRVIGLTGTMQDITERREADEKLLLAASVFEQTRDGIIITDANANIVAVNDAFARITGYDESEALGRNPRMLHSERHDADFYQALWHALLSTGQWRGEIWNRRKDGQIFPAWQVISAIKDDQGRTTGYVSVFSDLSDIRQANQQLEFLLNHDPLTRLPNRALLNDRLQQAIDAARSAGRQVALLLLNIDRLQRVNDSIGHDAGDALLREVAQRLQARLHAGDTLGRPGSDEFLIVLTNFNDADDIITAAQQLRECVTAPCMVAGHELTVTASIGVSIYPDDGTAPGDLLKAADTALSHVKSSGRNGVRFFTAEMNARALHWMSLEHRLRRAIERDELSLHYQPQICLRDGRICGIEALARWNNAELGAVPPADFIPLAEDTGLIVAIGEWVIRTACAQNMAWQRAGLPATTLAVNVSAHQLAARSLPDIVRRALDETGLPPHCLELELTESVLMHDTEAALQQIDALRDIGVTVSLDDFGTGYSSLGYLSRFTLDKLKVDQCFVRDITSNPTSAAIANATITLAHGLGIKVVAEGVETEQQLAYLRIAGCDEIQGYLVSRPVHADDMAALLARQALLPPNPVM